MNKKTILFLIQIPVWIIVFAFVLVIGYNSNQSIDTSILIYIFITYAFILLAYFYIYYSFLVPRYLEKRKYKWFAIYSLFIILLTIPFDQAAFLEFYYWLFGEGDFSSDNPPPVSINNPYFLFIVSLTPLFFGLLGIFYRFVIDWFKNVEVKKDLENKNLLSELKTLKSKLNPHLLFNTLNNIDTLIQTSPEQASATLSKLSDILRYVVYDTENENILIQKEIDNLQKYVELEKIRLVNPDAVEFTSNVSNETVIPPMLFFPFVENAFKHSNLNKTNQKLQISINEDKSKINFKCTNTINENKQNGVASGMGLELAKKRLDLLFPGTHVLTINKVDNEFRVNLEIQIE